MRIPVIPVVSFLMFAGILSMTGTTVWGQSCDDRDAATGGLGWSFYRRGWDESRCRGKVGSLFAWRSGNGEGLPQLDEPLVTDRPDFTEASSVVGLGVLQTELGYTYTEGSPDDGGRDQTYPELLLRYGFLFDWMELRVAYSAGSARVNGSTLAGSDDLYLGLKLGLTEQLGWLPETAIIPQMTVPSGGGDRTEGRVLAGVNYLYSWSLSEDISTGGSTQFNRSVDGETNNLYTEWAQSWTVAYSLTDRVGAFTEYFGFYPDDADAESPQHFVNGGFTYLLHDNLQLDIRAGKGLSSASEDYFIGTGLVLRRL